MSGKSMLPIAFLAAAAAGIYAADLPPVKFGSDGIRSVGFCNPCKHT